MSFKDNIVFQVVYIQLCLKRVFLDFVQKLSGVRLFIVYVVRRLPSTVIEQTLPSRLCSPLIGLLHGLDIVFLCETGFKNFHIQKWDFFFTLARTVKTLTENEGLSVATLYHTVVRHFKTLLRSIGSSRMKGEPKSWALLWPRKGFRTVMAMMMLD